MSISQAAPIQSTERNLLKRGVLSVGIGLILLQGLLMMQAWIQSRGVLVEDPETFEVRPYTVPFGLWVIPVLFLVVGVVCGLIAANGHAKTQAARESE